MQEAWWTAWERVRFNERGAQLCPAPAAIQQRKCFPMSHTAELIAVGTELLLGNIANTDAQMLSQGLSALGINVYYHTVVGDNPSG